jgi:plasmid segregation protein ParM
MEKFLFAIDHGNSDIKTPEFSFPSGLTAHTARPPLGADLLEFGGVFYSLTQPTAADYLRDKTLSNRYFVLTLFALAKELRAKKLAGQCVAADLAVGLPPGHFKQPGLRGEFRSYFQRGVAQFRCNGEEFCVGVEDVFVFPQAFAAVAPSLREIARYPMFYVVDVGGMTVDVMLLRDGKPDLSVLKSLEMGALTACSEIAERADAEFDCKVDAAHIRAVMANEKTLLPDDVVPCVRDGLRSWADKLVNRLTMGGIHLKTVPSRFIGGGAAFCEPFIELPGVTFDPDPRANARGFLALAAARRNAAAAAAAP